MRKMVGKVRKVEVEKGEGEKMDVEREKERWR